LSRQVEVETYPGGGGIGVISLVTPCRAVGRVGQETHKQDSGENRLDRKPSRRTKCSYEVWGEIGARNLTGAPNARTQINRPKKGKKGGESKRVGFLPPGMKTFWAKVIRIPSKD